MAATGRGIARAWSAVLHPQRRGLPDPTWGQASVALVALGSVLIAVDAATASTSSTRSGSVLHPNQTLLWVGLAIVVVGAAGLIAVAVTAFSRWRDDRRTPFKVEFEPDDPDCVDLLEGDYWQQLRVRVTNVGSQGVQRVRAFLRLEDGSYSYFLHIQHDNQYQVSRIGEYLATQQEMYFDVAVVKRDFTNAFFWCYADLSISDKFRYSLASGPTSWLIQIDVSGWSDFRDVVGTSKSYRLTLDEGFQLSMEEVP